MKQYRWDGHCHTEFCPHGKGDSTALMIEQAIRLGFTKLSLTEHAPLPTGLIEDKALFDELALTKKQLPEYLEKGRALKHTYRNKIELLVGLEVDYIPGYEDYLLDFYGEWGDQIEDSLLSVHFIGTKDNPLMIDYSPDHFRQTVLAQYGDLTSAHRAYWDTVMASVTLPFGEHKPNRLGHLGLISKFAQIFPPPTFGQGYFEPLVGQIKAQGYALDYNVAGFSNKTCGQAYMPTSLMRLAQAAKVPIVYGSDAHSIKAIGLHYEPYQELGHA